MPLIHRLLFGEGAGAYLPFAESRLRALQALDPEGFFSQTFIVDNATIHVRQEGKFQYIRIDVGGGFYFEFQTSGWPLETTEINDPILGTYTLYNSMVVATDVSVIRGAIHTEPYIRNNQRDPQGGSRNGWQPQIQLISEPVRYPIQDAGLRARHLYQKTLYETWAPKHSHTGIGYRNTLLHYSAFEVVPLPGSLMGPSERDHLYDEQWTFGDKYSQVITSTYYDNTAADWPRSSGYQTVVSEEWGTRVFGIMIDTFGRFHVFPVGAVRPLTLETIAQSVLPENTKDTYPDFPSWMYKPDDLAKNFWPTNGDERWKVKMPDYDWRFNLFGTKACAVVYGRTAYVNDATFWATDPDPDTPWEQTDFDLLVPWLGYTAGFRAAPPGESDYEPQRYMSGPGLIEATINITLTGAELKDFEVTIDIETIRDPNTNDYFTAYAGYSWINSSASSTQPNDLITLDIECYGRTEKTNGGADIDQSHQNFMSMKNLTRGTEVCCVPAHPILACELTTLSLVLRLTELERGIERTAPSNGSSSNVTSYWTREYFAVWIMREGQTQTLLYPETMPQSEKNTLSARAVFTGRAQITTLLTGSWALAKLQGSGKDGWSDSDLNTYRRYWGGKKHYWYIQPWVLFDPDYDFHGTNPFADEGWVRYQTEVAIPSVRDAIEQELLGLYAPPVGSTEHLFFCDHPRWGWAFYEGVAQAYIVQCGTTTFFTHPNGSYAFFTPHLIYNPFGGVATNPADDQYEGNADTLSIYDISTIEHCIFDTVHLEVRGITGRAATLDTSFMELYNRAVEKGLEEETLADGISTMTKADQRGTFEKETVLETYDDTTDVQVLQLKFTWNGVEYYYVEKGVRGRFAPDSVPSPIFPPFHCGGIIGLDLTTGWYSAPYVADTAQGLSPPDFVDSTNLATYRVRFANPQILMG